MEAEGSNLVVDGKSHLVDRIPEVSSNDSKGKLDEVVDVKKLPRFARIVNANKETIVALTNVADPISTTTSEALDDGGTRVSLIKLFEIASQVAGSKNLARVDLKNKIAEDKKLKRTIFYSTETCGMTIEELTQLESLIHLNNRIWETKPEDSNQGVPGHDVMLDYLGHRRRKLGTPRQPFFSIPPIDALTHVIYPDGSRKIAWNLLMIVIILVCTIAEVFYIGFGIELKGSILAFDIFMDVMFWMDICISFRTAYYDDEGGLEGDAFKVARAYLTRDFPVDFISVFPIDDFAGLFYSDSSFLRATRLIRLFRLSRLARLLEVTKIPDLLKDWVNPSFVKAFNLIFTQFVIAHFLACTMYLVVTTANEDTYTWADQYGGIRYMGLGVQYQSSLYWAFTTLATVGYGDIIPVNDNERGIVMVGVLLGATYFGYTVAYMGEIFRNVNVRGGLYEEKLEFVKEFVRSRRLPGHLAEQLIEHYRYYYKHASVFDCAHFFDSLPSENAVALQRIQYGAIITQFKFLRKCNPIFASRLAALMKPFCLHEGEILFFENDIPQQVYFVLHGYVDLLASAKTRSAVGGVEKSLIMVASVGDGDFFGEGVLLSDERALYTARASEFTELFFVNKSDLVELLEAWPTARPVFDKMASGFREHLERLRTDFERKAVYSGGPLLKSFVTAKFENELLRNRAQRTRSELDSSRDGRILFNFEGSRNGRIRSRSDLDSSVHVKMLPRTGLDGSGNGARKTAGSTDKAEPTEAGDVEPREGRKDSTDSNNMVKGVRIQAEKRPLSRRQRDDDPLILGNNKSFEVDSLSFYASSRRQMSSALFIDSDSDDDTCSTGSLHSLQALRTLSLSSYATGTLSRKLLNEKGRISIEEKSRAVLESIVAIKKHGMKYEKRHNRLTAAQADPWTMWVAYRVIHPEANTKVVWDLFICILIIYSILFDSFELAFDLKTEGSFIALSWLVSSFFCVDMVLSCRTTYVDSYHCLVKNTREIFLRYLRGWFPCDLMSTIPFDVIVDPLVESSRIAVGEIRVVKMLRLLRMLRIFRLAKVGVFLNRLTERMMIPPAMNTLLVVGLVLFFMCHAAGCLWYAIGTIPDPTLGTWLTNYCFYINVNNVNGTTSGSDERCAISYDISSEYEAAVYWAFVTMTTVGFGDIHPTVASTPETVLTIFVILFGTMITAYVVNSLVEALRHANQAQRRQVDVQENLKAFLWELRVSPGLSRRFVDQLTHTLEFRGALDQKVIFDTLPVHLGRRVVYELYFSYLQNLPLLRELEDRCPGVASMVLPRLRPAVYEPGEVMVSSAMCPREVVFVILGSCQCVPRRGFRFGRTGSQPGPVTVHQGSFFGQDTLFHSLEELLELRTYVKAVEAVETMTLTHDDWRALEVMYPTVMSLFKKRLLEGSDPEAAIVMQSEKSAVHGSVSASDVRVSTFAPEEAKDMDFAL